MDTVSLTLREVRSEALDTKTFVFDAEGLKGFQAGQYLMVKLDVPEDPRRGSRSFSLANSPTEDKVLITTRMRSGSAFKARLASLRSGDLLSTRGPLGKFTLHGGPEPALFLAAGVGVTPFRSMIRYAIDSGRQAPITLLVSDRVPEAAVFVREFDAWSQENPWFAVHRTITRPGEARTPWAGRAGRADEAWIRETVPGLQMRIAYVAGPPAFVDRGTTLLRDLGLPLENIRLERFIGY